MSRFVSPFLLRDRRAWLSLGLVCVTFAAAFLSRHRHDGPIPAPQKASRIAAPPERSTPSIETVDRRAASKPGDGMADVPDASNFYKDAFVLYDKLTSEEKKMLKDWKTQPDPEKAKALAEKIRPILELMKQAAQVKQCDWGFGPYTIDTPIPFLSQSIALSQAPLWDAAHRFQSDPRTAIEDLQSLRQLGHNISDLLIGSVMETSFEVSMFNVVRQSSAYLDSAALEEAADFMREESPLQADWDRSINQESLFVRSSMEQIAKKPAAEQEQYLQKAGAFDDLTSQAKEKQLKSISNPTSLKAAMDRLQTIEYEFGQTLTWPEDRFQAWWQRTKDSTAEDPLLSSTLSALYGVRTGVLRAIEEKAMVLAGLGVLQSGAASLPATPDPRSGAAFTYVPTPAGFDLRSTFIWKGAPLSVSFTVPPHE